MRKDRARVLQRLPRHTEGSGAFKLEKVGVAEFDLNDPYHQFAGWLAAGRVFLQH